MQTLTKEQLEKSGEHLDSLVPMWTKLLIELKAGIGEDYRAYDGDETPGMQVTFGFTPESEEKDFSWSYQTGDNSYTGGAYSHRYWGVVSLYRRSKSRDIAEDAANQIADQLHS